VLGVLVPAVQNDLLARFKRRERRLRIEWRGAPAAPLIKPLPELGDVPVAAMPCPRQNDQRRGHSDMSVSPAASVPRPQRLRQGPEAKPETEARQCERADNSRLSSQRRGQWQGDHDCHFFALSPSKDVPGVSQQLSAPRPSRPSGLP
jgi:hypothetical protein